MNPSMNGSEVSRKVTVDPRTFEFLQCEPEPRWGEGGQKPRIMCNTSGVWQVPFAWDRVIDSYKAKEMMTTSTKSRWDVYTSFPGKGVKQAFAHQRIKIHWDLGIPLFPLHRATLARQL